MSTNTPTTLVSRLKEVYPNGITQLVPTSTQLMRRIAFKEDLTTGEKARFDVQLSHENGFTVGQGEVQLNGAVAQSTAKAEVEGFSILLQSRVSYDLITHATRTHSPRSKHIGSEGAYRTGDISLFRRLAYFRSSSIPPLSSTIPSLARAAFLLRKASRRSSSDSPRSYRLIRLPEMHLSPTEEM